jgi:predicted transcriptional regulator
MAGHTVSAYADEQTYQKVTQLAKLEDRSTAQIVSAALRLYLRLPRHAHDAIRRAEADGPESADAAAWAISKALLHQQYEAALAEGLKHMPDLISPDDDEEAILAKAVEITRRPRP